MPRMPRAPPRAPNRLGKRDLSLCWDVEQEYAAQLKQVSDPTSLSAARSRGSARKSMIPQQGSLIGEGIVSPKRCSFDNSPASTVGTCVDLKGGSSSDPRLLAALQKGAQPTPHRYPYSPLANTQSPSDTYASRKKDLLRWIGSDT